MGKAIVTLKIMPEGVDSDLNELEKLAKKKIDSFAGEGETRSSVEPLAFGLNVLKIIFVMDEDLGSPDGLAEEIANIPGVQSCEVCDVRRAIG